MMTLTGDQPYAPPETGPRDAASELKKTPVVLTILLAFVTLGLYFPYWFLSRRKALNHLAPEDDDVNLVTFSLAGLYAIGFGAGLYQGLILETGDALSPSFYTMMRWINYASRILTIVAGFRVKMILEGHYPERLSAVGTFFLSIFYLQYRINRAGQTDPIAEHFTLR